MAEAKLGSAEQQSLTNWGDFPIAAGNPVEITSRGPLPESGIRITRSYAHPLPPDASATLAYFNSSMAAWVAVPSQVSADRRSVTAVVHHLSLWTDLVSGTQQAMKAMGDLAAQGADWAYYNVGKIFDVRVDAPACDSPLPAWVDNTTFIETHRNNPLLFCTGVDKAHSELLVIKARVNRGFGFNAEVVAAPSWTYNSTFETKDLGASISVLSDLDATLAESMRAVTGDGRMVGPGEELSLGLSEQAGRDLKSGLALRLTPQPPLPFLITTLGQLVGTDMTTRADGYVGALMATAHCAQDVSQASDSGGLARAALACVSGVDEQIAKKLALYLLKRNVSDPGKLAGRIVGKVSIYLALIGPVFNGMNYWAEQSMSVDGGRTVHVFPTISASRNAMTLQRLAEVEIPSLCEHPPGRLKDGVRPGNGNNGQVELDKELSVVGEFIPSQPAAAAAVFHCSQGGIGWPDHVLFYDSSAQLVGHLDTGIVGASAGRQRVEQVKISESAVEVTITGVPREGENSLWGSATARVNFGWDTANSIMQRTKTEIS